MATSCSSTRGARLRRTRARSCLSSHTSCSGRSSRGGTPRGCRGAFTRPAAWSRLGILSMLKVHAIAVVLTGAPPQTGASWEPLRLATSLSAAEDWRTALDRAVGHRRAVHERSLRVAFVGGPQSEYVKVLVAPFLYDDRRSSRRASRSRWRISSSGRRTLRAPESRRGARTHATIRGVATRQRGAAMTERSQRRLLRIEFMHA